MDMTLKQYIANPLGKSNAVMNATAREAIRTSYMQKFDAIMVREHGRLDYKLYKDEKRNRYYAYFKIPSETVEKFYYDVVIEFFTNEDVEEAGKNLLDYNIKFFSNDPAFNFTYAYVFYNNDLYVNDLKSKMSKKARSTAANEKNPGNQVGYVKTIYFAYLAMINRGLTSVDKFEAEATTYNSRQLKEQVMDTDQKVFDREEAGKKLEKKKKTSTTDKERSKTIPQTKTSLGVAKTKTVGKTSTIKKIGATRKTKIK